MKIKQVLKSRTVSLVGGILAGFAILIVLGIYFLTDSSSTEVLTAVAIVCSLIAIFLSTAESKRVKKDGQECKSNRE
ncbi:MAG: hypothetical protein MUF68_06405 [Cyclobacteriaceae bacterium]|nr:hypothetical protein [Cyclobacteriaceae bacterium]